MKRLAICALLISSPAAALDEPVPVTGPLIVDRLHIGTTREDVRKLYHFGPVPFSEQCRGELDADYKDGLLFRANFESYNNADRKKCGKVVRALLEARFGAPLKKEREVKSASGGGTVHGGVTGTLNQLGKADSTYYILEEWFSDGLKIRFKFDDEDPTFFSGFFEKVPS